MREKDELTRQCEMAWGRGRDFGLVIGFILGGLFPSIGLVIVLLFN